MFFSAIFITFVIICSAYLLSFSAFAAQILQTSEKFLGFLAISCEVTAKQQILFSQCLRDLVTKNVLDMSSVLLLFK